VRPPIGIEPIHPRILDSHFFPKRGHFLFQAVVLGFQSNSLVAAIGRPTTAVDQGILGQREDVDHSGFDEFVPAFGEWDLRRGLLAGHFLILGSILFESFSC